MEPHRKATQPPRIADIENVLLDLIGGTITRQQASDWAWPWFGNLDVELSRDVQEIIDYLYGADTPTTDRDYLYDETDFRLWLVRPRNAQRE